MKSTGSRKNKITVDNTTYLTIKNYVCFIAGSLFLFSHNKNEKTNPMKDAKRNNWSPIL